MYESFFGLSQRPFASAPLVERYFPASSIDGARQTLARCVDRAEGCGLCIGGPGMGKSLLLAVLADQFSEPFTAALLSAGSWGNRREFLQALCYELKIAYQGLDEGELRLAVVNQLTRTDKFRRGIVLLVDEAHSLSVSLLEELRMLSNLVRGGEPCVRLVLAGNLRLEELLASPQLESFSQRITCRCYLEPFDRSETIDYVRFQIAVAGGRAEHVFQPAAVDAVYRASDGVPRLVNQMCDHALLLSYEKEERPVAAQGVQAAWADLQQLPTPWQEPPALRIATGEAAAFIEFGSLDDDDVSSAGESLEDDVIEFPSADDAWETAEQAELATEHVHDEDPGRDEQQHVECQGHHEHRSESEIAESVVSQHLIDDIEPVADTHESQEGKGAAAHDDAHRTYHESHDFQPTSSEAWQEEPQAADDALHSRPDDLNSLKSTEAHFEELERQLAEFQNVGQESLGQTEAEIAFEDENWFDDFEQEERLIDPYAQAVTPGQAVDPTCERSEHEPVAEHENTCSAESIAEPIDGDWAAEEAVCEQHDADLTADEIEPPATEQAAPEFELPEEPEWNADEEWSVDDNYHNPHAVASVEISAKREPKMAAEDQIHEPVDNQPCEVVVNPYEGLADLEERLRREAQALEAATAGTARAGVDAAGDAGDSYADASADADEPAELHAAKLTLAEVMRRRLESDLAQKSAPPQGSSHKPATEDKTVESDETRTSPRDTAETVEESLIVIEDDSQPVEPPSDEEPRVQRKDYRELFAKLRRG